MVDSVPLAQHHVAARAGTDGWAPPTGTITVLLTDQQPSSQLWEEVPEAMDLAAARHDAVVRSVIARWAHAFVVTAPAGLLIELAAQRHHHARSRASSEGRTRTRVAQGKP